MYHFFTAKISTLEMLETFENCFQYIEKLSSHGITLRVSLISILSQPTEFKTETEVNALLRIMKVNNLFVSNSLIFLSKNQRVKIKKLDLSFRRDIWHLCEHRPGTFEFLISALKSVQILDLTGCSITIMR